MNIAIAGTGGVGGYFGSRLTRLQNINSNVAVYFISRGAHLEAIKENGLTVDSDEGVLTCHPSIATDTISELPELDLCLICVKSFDLEKVLAELKPKIKDSTIILPLLNGIDICERIRSVISNGVVLPACVYVGTHIEKAGFIKQRGGTCTIHFGKDPKYDTIDNSLFDNLNDSGIKFIFHTDPYKEIWSKYIFIASYGMVTAAFNKTIGEVLESDELSGSVMGIITEVFNIAARRDIILPETIINDSFLKGKNFPFETKTSFQRDYEIQNRADERDLFGKTIISLGRLTGINTAVTESVYKLIEDNKILKSRS